jgi:hypothetical protein
LSRPWSASIRLFAYCSVLWNAAGISSSITARNPHLFAHDAHRDLRDPAGESPEGAIGSDGAFS